MRVLLTHPFSWPYVRRGSERFMAELSAYLAARGHKVTIFSSRDGDEQTTREGGVTRINAAQLWHPTLAAVGLSPETTFAWRCLSFLRRERFDVIHCLYFSDGFAAALTAARQGTPYIQHLTGIPSARIPRRRPIDYPMLRVAIARAARVVTVSRAAAAGLATLTSRPADVLPVPCDLRTFTLDPAPRRPEAPIILGIGAFSQRRKGLSVLMRAFERLKPSMPGATLEVSGHVPEELRARALASLSPAARDAVRFLGVGRLEDLPKLYARAAVTVLPSIGESFGMTLVESLACGTPVVGSTDGGVPEIVTPQVGALFHPGDNRREPTNDEGLAAAIATVLARRGDPELPAACAAAVRRFGWDVLGPRYEQLYEDACKSPREAA